MISGADLAIRIGAAFTGAKAFAKADASVGKLTKSVGSLGKGLGVTFGAAVLGRYAKEAVKAFAADDKAAQMLTKSLENLGLGFQSVNVSDFIASLEKTYAVADDLLRPAFQKLLTTTGSVAESQRMLKTALNLSAASGADVASTSADLSKAYVGQTRALAKYGLGLSQAELKAMSFEDVQKKINTLFSGQAALAVNSYSGSIDKLSVAAGNAQEIIGQGLVEAIGKLGGGGADGIDNVTKSMEGLSKAGSGVINTFADVFQAIFHPMEYLKNGMNELKAFGVDSPEAARGLAMQKFYDQKKISDAAIKSERDRARLAALALKREKQAAAALAKSKKDALALSKIGQIFEMDKIQIIAALQGKISQEERTRLELQLAILTGNVDEATRLTNQLAESQGLSKELAAFLKTLPDANNPFTAWETYLAGIEARVRKILDLSAFANNPNLGGSVGSPVIGSVSEGIGTTTAGQAAQLYGGMGPAIGQQPVYVNVQIAGEDVNAIVTGGLQNQSLSGQQAFINRIYGQFGG